MDSFTNGVAFNGNEKAPHLVGAGYFTWLMAHAVRGAVPGLGLYGTKLDWDAKIS